MSVIDTYTAGDPMHEGVQWTNLRRPEIAARLSEEGFPVSVTVVDRLLEEFQMGYRTPQKIRTMTDHPDRNKQFEHIDELKRIWLESGEPILSMDTKRREMLGDYARPGQVLSTGRLRAWDHDFPTHSPGVVIPHGLFDLGRNEGYMHLGTSHDTSDFAIDAFLDYWRTYGCRRYPRAEDLLLLCDGGEAAVIAGWSSRNNYSGPRMKLASASAWRTIRQAARSTTPSSIACFLTSRVSAKESSWPPWSRRAT